MTAEGLSDRFKRLLDRWRRERNPLSSSVAVQTNTPAYKAIIELGEPALPLIFKELQDNPDHPWLFPALAAITSADPVKEEIRGQVREMAEAWIDWAAENGYLDGAEAGNPVETGSAAPTL